MKTLKYTVISSVKQYNAYCNILEELVFAKTRSSATRDEIDLLTLLIENYDEKHNTFAKIDPIRMLLSLMQDHNMKPKDLVNLLGVSKGYVSDILHYKKGLSKDVIRIIANHFKMRQEAFNRPYTLVSRSTRLNKSKKELAASI